MVVLTINASSNDYTVYFDYPIPKPNSIRLLSCSLYNSWFNLLTRGKITIIDTKDNDKKYSANFPPNFYTLESFSETLKFEFLKHGIEVITDEYKPTGMLYFQNPDPSRLIINISEELAELFVIKHSSTLITFGKKIESTEIYSIHCDLVDKQKNLLNGKPSSILARFDVRGNPYQKISYKPDLYVLRDTMSGEYLSSLTISVRNKRGELLNFNAFPLEFELEIH